MKHSAEIRRALKSEGWTGSKTLLKHPSGIGLYLGHETGMDGAMDDSDRMRPSGSSFSVEFNAYTPAAVVIASARAAISEPQETPQ